MRRELKLPPPAHKDPVLISIWIVGAAIGLVLIVVGGTTSAFGVGLLGGVAITFAMVHCANAADSKD